MESKTKILECGADGPPLGSERDANDLVGEALGQGAEWVVIPLARLSPEFFQLRTRVAGDFLQKFVNYRLRVAIVGDVAPLAAESKALADFVRESNRGQQLWFVATRDELARKMSSHA